MDQRAFDKKNSGYVALISVLVVAGISVVIGVTLLTLGLGSSRTSFAMEQSQKARVLADACAEEALQQIRDSSSFTGSNPLTLGGYTCNYTVTDTGGENRTATASASVGSITRKVKVMISAITPDIVISSWEEVADF